MIPLLIDIFGIKMPEGLFYALMIAGSIFYVFMIWFILQLMRRKMPIRVQKAGLGQSLEEYKGKEDDIKVYWKEGFFGKPHEAIKVTKERIKTHWGVPNKEYLVRSDFNLTVPFVRDVNVEALKALDLTEKDLEIINTHLTKQKNPEKEPFPIETLSAEGRSKIQLFESKLIDFCKKCQDKIPEFLTVRFIDSDQLMGSTTEATTQRRNEDFVNTASRSLKRVNRGDVFLYLLVGAFSGSMLMLMILMVTGVLKFA